MTQEKIRRVNQAIQETQKLLNKELSFSTDLQKHDKIDWYKKHIVNLQSMASS